MSSLRATKLLVGALACLLLAGVPAAAVTNSDGDLYVSFNGRISPSKLPRTEPAPVGVRVAGSFGSLSGDLDRLPQLRRIVVGINRGGKMFNRGLPECSTEAIRSSAERRAREVCGGAIIGTGHASVQVRIPGQLPFMVRAKLLAFNGPRKRGHEMILAQVYAGDPPGSFMIPFRVSRRPGTYGTVLSATLPPETREWAYLTHFDMELRRVYSYHGRKHSYVSASCAVPAGYRKVVFPFARATYSFANGQRLSLDQNAVCRVAGP